MSAQENRISPTETHKEMVARWMQDPEFKAGYDALEDEYALLRELLRARKRVNLTQEEVAQKMGTKGSAVARIESSILKKKPSPSISTLRKYAQAVGCTLEIKFKPILLNKAIKDIHSNSVEILSLSEFNSQIDKL